MASQVRPQAIPPAGKPQRDAGKQLAPGIQTTRWRSQRHGRGQGSRPRRGRDLAGYSCRPPQHKGRETQRARKHQPPRLARQETRRRLGKGEKKRTELGGYSMPGSTLLASGPRCRKNSKVRTSYSFLICPVPTPFSLLILRTRSADQTRRRRGTVRCRTFLCSEGAPLCASSGRGPCRQGSCSLRYECASRPRIKSKVKTFALFWLMPAKRDVLFPSANMAPWTRPRIAPAPAQRYVWLPLTRPW